MDICLCVCVCAYARVWTIDICLWMRVCGHLSVCTCNCVSVCCVFMRVRGHLCVCASVCVRVRVDMYVQVWTLCECVHDVGCSVCEVDLYVTSICIARLEFQLRH